MTLYDLPSAPLANAVAPRPGRLRIAREQQAVVGVVLEAKHQCMTMRGVRAAP